MEYTEPKGMDAEKKEPVKNKIVGYLNFKGDEDGDLLELANTYRRLRPGLTLKAAIRNFLLEKLPGEIEQLQGGKKAAS
jgi:hypothetical protein